MRIHLPHGVIPARLHSVVANKGFECRTPLLCIPELRPGVSGADRVRWGSLMIDRAASIMQGAERLSAFKQMQSSREASPWERNMKAIPHAGLRIDHATTG